MQKALVATNQTTDARVAGSEISKIPIVYKSGQHRQESKS